MTKPASYPHDMPRGLAAVPEIRRDRLAENGIPIGLWRVQCRATSKRTGKQCGAWAIPGLMVCRWHGGSTRAAQEAGRRRIMILTMPAIDTLAKLLEHKDPDVRRRSAEAILDRSGRSISEIYEAEEVEAERRSRARSRRSRGAA